MVEKCVICGNEKEYFNIHIGKGKSKVAVCDKCAYPKPIPLKHEMKGF